MRKFDCTASIVDQDNILFIKNDKHSIHTFYTSIFLFVHINKNTLTELYYQFILGYL